MDNDLSWGDIAALRSSSVAENYELIQPENRVVIIRYQICSRWNGNISRERREMFPFVREHDQYLI